MILSELKDFLQEQKVCSMEELVLNFNSDPDTIREMLAVWIRKGKVRQLQGIDVKCQKCAQCNMFANEIYEWIDDKTSD